MRSLEEVQREYSQACMELGQLVYQLSIVQEDVANREYQIEKLQNKIKSLNQEGHKIQQGSAAVPADATPVEVPNE